MAEPATRVALLARPGAACDNLQVALRQAGADVVAVQDPGEGDPSAIAAAHPSAVLVALEPAVEDALERYDTVLSEPGRLVIYDEVAIAARREGWAAARWARHLAAKLGGHADVLPPGAGNDDHVFPATSAIREPSVQPAQPEFPAPPASTGPAVPAVAHAQGDELALESMEFDADAVHLGVEPAQEEALAQAGNGIDFGGFTPEMMAAMTLEADLEPVIATAADSAPDAFAGDAHEPARTGIDDDAGGHVLEWDVAPVSASAPAAPEPAASALAAPEPAAAPAQSPATPAPAPVRFNLDEMSLVDIEPAPKAPGSRQGPAPGAHGIGGDGGGEGAVVVLAGIGGPDAVRQFLAGLPGGFARPIIVRQRLDGGRHDRLVRQMQRATALPVELAEAGRRLVAGHVYILPDDMTTAGDNGATTFVATSGPVPVLAGLPAGDSAVLVLSGSDPAAVPELMDAAREGALVAGQSPEDSFDGAAAAALLAAGGESHTAAGLAQRLSSRWLSLKD
jgi:chemosensory pili system protein ChpB (putative protein-glutamate methylesterase)